MSEEKVYRAIGLMSGTALDGEIDVALIETNGQKYTRALDFYTHPYDLSIRDKVRACFGKRENEPCITAAETLITDLHIAAVKDSGFDGDIIGFHGQTITHAPEERFTWQIGDGQRLAKETGITVIANMRSRDVQAGGQGAPLLPLYHQARLENTQEPIIILNLGGVANITYIHGGNILAFDCGPANALMDDLMRLHTGEDFDENGKVASQGQPDEKIINTFLKDDFFSQSGPKSLDRNHWKISLVENLPLKNAMATLMAMTTQSIEKSIGHLPHKPKNIYVAGGGRKNKFLMNTLNERLSPASGSSNIVQPVEHLGWNGDATEAEGFAYLAVRSLLGLPLSLPETTGVPTPLTGGDKHLPE